MLAKDRLSPPAPSLIPPVPAVSESTTACVAADQSAFRVSKPPPPSMEGVPSPSCSLKVSSPGPPVRAPDARLRVMSANLRFSTLVRVSVPSGEPARRSWTVITPEGSVVTA